MFKILLVDEKVVWESITKDLSCFVLPQAFVASDGIIGWSEIIWLLERWKKTLILSWKKQKTCKEQSEVNATHAQLLTREAKSKVLQEETQIYETVQY